MMSPAREPSTVTALPAKAFSFSGLETLKIFVPTTRTAGEPMPMHFLAHISSETTPWKVSAIAVTERNVRLRVQTARSFFMETSGWCNYLRSRV